MAMPRPYGLGPYGAGPYSRYRAIVYEVGGATSILFDATARPSRLLHAEAISEIRFSATCDARVSWSLLEPCDTGAWNAADPCSTGTWTPLPPCEPGMWTSVRP